MQIWKWISAPLVLAGCAPAPLITRGAEQVPGHGTVAFAGVTVVPMDRDGVLRNQNVITRAGRIVALGPASQLRLPAGARVIDGAGRFLIPGLWDMHVHLMTSPESTMTLSERATRVYFPQLLANGVTGVRDMGAHLDSIVALRDRIRAGEVLGPRLIIAGALLAGHNPWAPPSEHSWTVQGSQDARAMVDSLRRAGADFIKVHDMLSDSAFFAVAAAARATGMKLVGHMRPQLTVRQVVDAGQVGLDHLPIELVAECSGGGTAAATRFYTAWIRGGWIPYINETVRMWSARDPARCSSILGYLRTRNVAVTPTVVLRMQDSVLLSRAAMEHFTPAAASSCRQNVADWGAVSDSLRTRYRATVLDVVGTLHRAGVAVFAGSDGPGGCLAPGAALHEELLNLTETGMTPLEALRSATILPARFMGLADSVGAVAVGHVADLVLLNADPTTDIRNARSIEGVMVRGRWLWRAALDSLQSSSESATAPAVTLAITNASIVDPASGSVTRDRTVLIAGNRIQSIVPTSEASIGAGVQVLDARGKYLIPGLWDMHAHAWQWSMFGPFYLANGVTGVREMGSGVGQRRAGGSGPWGWREDVRTGRVPGPRMIAAGYILDGGDTTWYKNAPFFKVVRTAAEGERWVDSLVSIGADFIKVYRSLAPEVYGAIAARARSRGIPLEGHVPSRVGTRTAVTAGQRTIEHLTDFLVSASSEETAIRREIEAAILGENTQSAAFFREQALGDRLLRTYSPARAAELIRELARNGTWQVPTLVVHRDPRLFDPAANPDTALLRLMPRLLRMMITPQDTLTAAEREVGRQRFLRESAIVGDMHRAGVPILAGTDVGNTWVFPGFSLHDELELLVEAGLSPRAALAAATSEPARFMGSDSLGSVAVGRVADVVVLDGNPLEAIRNTRRISAVVANGQLLPRATLDSLLMSAGNARIGRRDNRTAPVVLR